MNDATLPPIIGEQSRQPRWRWGVHVFLLIGYVLGIGLIGAGKRDGSSPAGMPGNLHDLALFCAGELGLFFAIFGVAWFFSRARKDELFLKWRGAWRPILWGIGYSVALRIGIAIITLIVLLPFAALKGEKSVEKMRPKIEAVVDTKAMKDPAYFLFAATMISFVMAGFREELWRAGVIAGLAGLAPMYFSSRRGQYAAVLIAAVIFGIGHAPQGLAGVFLTGALGLGLGWIIVRHQSIWEAVLAHGFFDATTFTLLFIVLRFFPEALKGLGISP